MTASKRFEVINRGEDAEVWIYDDIGEGWFGGLSAKQFVTELKPIKNAKRISVYMNSPGGNVFDGIAMHNSLKRLTGEKTVYVDGLAASIASVIAMAGDKIVMAENALMMIHDPWTITGGYAGDLRKTADELDRVRDVIAGTYATRSTVPLDRLKALMAEETWFDAAMAIDHGLADETTAAKKMAAWVDWSRFRHPPTIQEFPQLAARREKLNRMAASLK